jgi:hypothetical protein
MTGYARVALWLSLALMLAVATAIYGTCRLQQAPRLVLQATHGGVLLHPAQVIRMDGRHIAAEVYNQRLVIGNDASFSKLQHLDRQVLGSPLASPHFMHILDDDSLLVSEGWGRSVVSVSLPPAAPVLHRFNGPLGDTLRAPHGICRDAHGWIYVADSLNSRLVRFRDLQGSDWQVFPDNGQKVAYGRQLLCREDGIWLANSYEKREGLNPGRGSNVLRIRDFASGEVEQVVGFEDSNMTGLELIDGRWLLLGLWQANRLLMIDTRDTSRRWHIEPPAGMHGPPYGIFIDEQQHEVLVSYLGDIHGKKQRGGFAVFRYH